MFLKQETRKLIIKITKDEIENLEIIKKYNEFMKSICESTFPESVFYTNYVMSYFEEEDLAMLYIHTSSSEDNIFTQTIPVNVIINELCDTQTIKVDVLSIISEKEKGELDNIIDGMTSENDSSDEEELEESWYLELEFDEENYIKFIESNVNLEL